MIRNQHALEAMLASGRHVSRQALMGEASSFRWALSDTNETVHGQALRALIDKGIAQPVAHDICGEPYEYGCAHA